VDEGSSSEHPFSSITLACAKCEGKIMAANVFDILSVLRKLEVNSMDMDDMIVIHSQAAGLVASYEKYRIKTPDFVIEALAMLDRDIKEKRRDYLIRQGKLLDAKELRLMSREEQRAAVQKERAEIDKLLNE
jgi:hypothetical protein